MFFYILTIETYEKFPLFPHDLFGTGKATGPVEWTLGLLKL
jgi:hypothetical protein